MPKLKLSKEEAQSIVWEDHDKAKIISKEIVDKSRWSIHSRMIFELDGKFYETYYSKGATEQQDERPFEYDDEVICTQVEPYQKTVTYYREVTD